MSVAGTDEVFFGNFRGTKNTQTAEDFLVPQPSFGPKAFLILIRLRWNRPKYEHIRISGVGAIISL